MPSAVDDSGSVTFTLKLRVFVVCTELFIGENIVTIDGLVLESGGTEPSSRKGFAFPSLTICIIGSSENNRAIMNTVAFFFISTNRS